MDQVRRVVIQGELGFSLRDLVGVGRGKRRTPAGTWPLGVLAEEGRLLNVLADALGTCTIRTGRGRETELLYCVRARDVQEAWPDAPPMHDLGPTHNPLLGSDEAEDPMWAGEALPSPSPPPSPPLPPSPRPSSPPPPAADDPMRLPDRRYRDEATGRKVPRHVCPGEGCPRGGRPKVAPGPCLACWRKSRAVGGDTREARVLGRCEACGKDMARLSKGRRDLVCGPCHRRQRAPACAFCGRVQTSMSSRTDDGRPRCRRCRAAHAAGGVPGQKGASLPSTTSVHHR